MQSSPQFSSHLFETRKQHTLTTPAPSSDPHSPFLANQTCQQTSCLLTWSIPNPAFRSATQGQIKVYSTRQKQTASGPAMLVPWRRFLAYHTRNVSGTRAVTLPFHGSHSELAPRRARQ
jgi:hypothetical protein